MDANALAEAIRNLRSVLGLDDDDNLHISAHSVLLETALALPDGEGWSHSSQVDRVGQLISYIQSTTNSEPRSYVTLSANVDPADVDRLPEHVRRKARLLFADDLAKARRLLGLDSEVIP